MSNFLYFTKVSNGYKLLQCISFRIHYNYFFQKVKLFSCFSLFQQLLMCFVNNFYVNFHSKYTHFCPSSPQLWCNLLQSVNITSEIVSKLLLFCFQRLWQPFFRYFLPGDWHLAGFVLHFIRKSCDEDTRLRKDSQREIRMVRGSRTPAASDTTSEPPGGNARTGAPVKASMSDGLCRNQGGTVECFCIPPLIFQGWDIFICPKPRGNS